LTKISAPNDAIYAPVGNNRQESSLKKVVAFTPKCPRKLSPVIVKNAKLPKVLIKFTAPY